ncbi:MAG TPA: tRNA 2-thiocytidine(32) synthetase TtcA [Polyangiaceae bacterium]
MRTLSAMALSSREIQACSDPPRVEQRLLKQLARASYEHQLIEPNDRIMVAVSGGKDSLSLLYLLREIQQRAPFQFSLVAVNVDQKQPGFPTEVLPKYFTEQGYPFEIVEDDTYSVVTSKIPEGKTYCSLCSRLRRGILYTTATRLGVTKIALGHHRDDCIETLLLNAFFAGQLRAMPAKFRSDDGRHVVIRPLIYCAERDLESFARQRAFPIIPCNLCGSQPNLQRRNMKELLNQLEQQHPQIRNHLFSSIMNVRATHLLDRGLLQRCGTDSALALESDALAQLRLGE